MLLAALAGGCVGAPDPARRNLPTVGLEAELPAAAIEVVIELPRPPGNVAVARDGQVFFTFHPEAKPTVKLAVVTPDGGWRPFPDDAWQRPRDGRPFFTTPLAVRADDAGRLWVLDHGDLGRVAPSLSAFAIDSGALVHRFVFPPEVAAFGSMLNDMGIDAARGVVYIADTSPIGFDPALVVYDIEARRARRVLEDHASVAAEDHHLVVQGRFMKVFGLPLQLGADSIALSRDGETLFWGPLAGATMWRMPTAALRDAANGDAELAARVEAVGPKPTTDGIIAAEDDLLYLTAIEDDAIAVLEPDGTLRVLARDRELLAWPDGLGLSPDGRWLYATASELHHVIGRDLDALDAKAPFRIVRIPIAAGR